MGTIKILSTIIGLLKNRVVLYLLIIGLGVVLFLLWRSNKSIEADLNTISQSAEKHVNDIKNELTVKLSDAEMKAHLKSSKIDSLIKELNIKPKNVIQYKYIKSDRLVHDTIREYELIEIGDYQQIFTFNEKCFTAKVDLTGTNPSIEAKISNEFIDINYTQRRPLLNIKRAPRWGKKVTYQTLISPCGDTIRENHKISTL